MQPVIRVHTTSIMLVFTWEGRSPCRLAATARSIATSIAGRAPSHRPPPGRALPLRVPRVEVRVRMTTATCTLVETRRHRSRAASVRPFHSEATSADQTHLASANTTQLPSCARAPQKRAVQACSPAHRTAVPSAPLHRRANTLVQAAMTSITIQSRRKWPLEQTRGALPLVPRQFGPAQRAAAPRRHLEPTMLPSPKRSRRVARALSIQRRPWVRRALGHLRR
jgi:hypothetical protein